MHRLELTDVEKKFGEKKAVQNVSLCLENGVYGLLGENGAGKTTLLRMVCGILQPTAGNILCDGIDIRDLGGEYRRILGYLPQEFGYYKEFTAFRFLNYMAALKAIAMSDAEKHIMEALELVDLQQYRSQKLKTFSGGMIRRLGIAQALLNEPEILILDEPTSGLDPAERIRFRNVISSLGKKGIVLLSTHIVPDVEYISDRILIMKNGKILKNGTQKQLAAETGHSVWKCIVPEERAEVLRKNFTVSNLRYSGKQFELRIISDRKPDADAVEDEPNLEDIYLYITRERKGGL